MIRRPAVTLIEVLIAMFIMAIGMLALLVLFPLGAVSMGQALKDDRCASTAAMAESVAIAADIRHDALVATGAPLVYVDPYGAGLGNLGSGIPRSSVSLSTLYPTPPYTPLSAQECDRWFSLPDDIGFNASGTPDTSTTGGIVDRGRRYSYAYLLRFLSTNLVQLYVVVYSGRPVNTLTAETTLAATGTEGNNSIVLGTTGTTIKAGGWVLDSVNGFFYRVTNVTESGGSTTVEVQTNLIANVTQLTIMDNVAEVFDKGTSWQP